MAAKIHGRFVKTRIHRNFSKAMHSRLSRNHHFFFVDDCVIVFFESKRDEMMTTTNELTKKFIIDIIDELKWFLEMHIIRNHLIKCLWLFQKTYIEKICKNLMKSSVNRSLFTPMNTAELLFAEDDEEISNESRILYQRKVGFLLFAVISTRPDIAFAVSKLSRFNVRFSRKHHAAVKWILQYFYHTKNICIRYGNNKIINKKRCLIWFVYVSDAFFANNTINWKNSQDYIIKLLNKPVTWQANKQNTVTTLFIEAEFLAILQTVKEIIYLFHLMKSLILHLSKFLFIECDNMQIIWLLIAEFFKLQTKLRHVNIHSHWLRQKIQWRSIHLNWMFIKWMIANDFIKTFTFINFDAFVKMIGFENKTQLLFSIQRKNTFKHAFIEKNDIKIFETFEFGFAKHWNVRKQILRSIENYKKLVTSHSSWLTIIRFYAELSRHLVQKPSSVSMKKCNLYKIQLMMIDE